MNNSKNRRDGGAYRRMKTMISAYAKEGKDRSKARRKQNKQGGANEPRESISSL